MTEISSEHFFCWEGNTRTHFKLKNLLNKNSFQSKLVSLCPNCSPIRELKVIGLDSVDFMLVNNETKQIEMKTASSLVSIFLLL
jgi:hypothetical protein